jgi:hypothetical protein
MTMAQGKATGRKGLRSAVKAALAVAVLVLLVPAAAQAHTGAATVSCDSANFTFKLFQPGSNTIHYAVTVDGSVYRSGDYTLDRNGGREGALSVPLGLTGDHYVVANAWWGPAGVVNGEKRSEYAPPLAKKKVYCPAPPVTPPAPPVTPPATPAAPPAAASAPAVTPPASAVAGVQVRSPATARAAFTSSCASRTARITIRGTQMRSVTLSVNGHRVRTVRVSSKTRTLRVRVPIARGRAQIVSARVSFRNGTAAKTLTSRAVRCAAAQVAPQFTG